MKYFRKQERSSRDKEERGRERGRRYKRKVADEQTAGEERKRQTR